MEPWASKLKSRKFWMAVIPAVTILISEVFGFDVDPEPFIGVAVIVSAWILGESQLDRQRISAEQRVAFQQLQSQAQVAVNDLQRQVEEKDAALQAVMNLNPTLTDPTEDV